MTPEEVQAFAARLEEFGAHLSPKERAFLEAILQRAAMIESDDVEGQGAMQMTLAALVVALSTTLGVTGASATTHPPDPARTRQPQPALHGTHGQGRTLEHLQQRAAHQDGEQHGARLVRNRQGTSVRPAIHHQEPVSPGGPGTPEEP
jgi:hypothetical protein